jgi:2-polyprenyl-3-methyl-5-hydroxy-6-metoxy-1,4-benzoquinol methylase
VLLTRVIEHVADPREFLAALSKAVRQGGMLLLSTPSGKAEWIRRFGGQWLGNNYFHIVRDPPNIFRDEIRPAYRRVGLTGRIR